MTEKILGCLPLDVLSAAPAVSRVTRPERYRGRAAEAKSDTYGCSVIVWVNGPFGVGKSTVAHELARQLPAGPIVLDPELIGQVLRTWTPGTVDVADFQDLTSWRRMTRSAIAGAEADFARHVIVPMTLLNPDYFQDIVGWLRNHGSDVRHFCLVADKATVTTRAAQRRDGTLGWVTANYDRYGPSLHDPRFGEFIAAAHQEAASIARVIASRLA